MLCSVKIMGALETILRRDQVKEMKALWWWWTYFPNHLSLMAVDNLWMATSKWKVMEL